MGFCREFLEILWGFFFTSCFWLSFSVGWKLQFSKVWWSLSNALILKLCFASPVCKSGPVLEQVWARHQCGQTRSAESHMECAVPIHKLTSFALKPSQSNQGNQKTYLAMTSSTSPHSHQQSFDFSVISFAARLRGRLGSNSSWSKLHGKEDMSKTCILYTSVYHLQVYWYASISIFFATFPQYKPSR